MLNLAQSRGLQYVILRTFLLAQGSPFTGIDKGEGGTDIIACSGDFAEGSDTDDTVGQNRFRCQVIHHLSLHFDFLSRTTLFDQRENQLRIVTKKRSETNHFIPPFVYSADVVDKRYSTVVRTLGGNYGFLRIFYGNI